MIKKPSRTYYTTGIKGSALVASDNVSRYINAEGETLQEMRKHES